MQNNSQDQNSRKSEEHKSRNVLLALGVIAFLVGIGLGLMIMPEALRTNHYPLMMLSIILPCIGTAFLYLAIKNRQLNTGIGETRLILDPPKPGLGGQLGAGFYLNPNEKNGFSSQAELIATLACYSTGSGPRNSSNHRSASISTIWKDKAPFYQKQTAKGIEASVVFDLPHTGHASNESNISWELMVEGSLDNLGEFQRTWAVEVTDAPEQLKSSIKIPNEFRQRYELQENQNALINFEKNIKVTNDANYIDFSSRLIPKVIAIIGIVFGVVFASFGDATFMLIGISIAAAAFIAGGMVTDIKIDKERHLLYSRKKFFGFTTSNYEGEIKSPDQFTVDEFSGKNPDGNPSGIYSVNFRAGDTTVKLAGLIEGERAANAIRERIVSQLFSEETQALAA